MNLFALIMIDRYINGWGHNLELFLASITNLVQVRINICSIFYFKNWKRKGTWSIGSIEEMVMLKLFSLESNLKKWLNKLFVTMILKYSIKCTSNPFTNLWYLKSSIIRRHEVWINSTASHPKLFVDFEFRQSKTIFAESLLVENGSSLYLGFPRRFCKKTIIIVYDYHKPRLEEPWLAPCVFASIHSLIAADISIPKFEYIFCANFRGESATSSYLAIIVFSRKYSLFKINATFFDILRQWSFTVSATFVFTLLLFGLSMRRSYQISQFRQPFLIPHTGCSTPATANLEFIMPRGSRTRKMNLKSYSLRFFSKKFENSSIKVIRIVFIALNFDFLQISFACSIKSPIFLQWCLHWR